MNIVDEAKRVFQSEASALIKASEQIDDTFEMVVNELSSCKGKVVITGVGKSGIIAQKISSTLSSLGTPSFFMHPVDAMHGDLGVLGREDIAVIISNSGDTKEVIDLIPYVKNRVSKVIGITSNSDSVLNNYCDYTQVLLPVDEACSFGIAPTSSSNVVMCYGDALAIAVSKLKGYSLEMFNEVHPGGVLAEKIKNIMKD